MTEQRNTQVEAQLGRWTEDLVDLGGRNRLIYFKHDNAPALGFRQEATEVQQRLSTSNGWSFYLPDELEEDDDEKDDPLSNELVITHPPKSTNEKTLSTLKKLSSKSRSYYLDTGIWSLYVGLGFLHWTEGNDAVKSPILLVPVEAKWSRSKQKWQLIATDAADITINPALALKIKEHFDIDLPTMERAQGTSCQNIFRKVKDALGDVPCQVESTTILRNFTFHKEVIYQDLKANEVQICEHPQVKLLAEGPQGLGDIGFNPVPLKELDGSHPPEELACILDADGTQRQCLSAAREGRSFVMDGPPGTGKSQTIANLIAQLIKDGKSVLFVSEKAAALEVVHNRLTAVGLGPFLLAIHSKKVSRKAVVAELGRALEESPRATTTFTPQNKADLINARKSLSEYATAVNETRRPLEKSLHEAVGRIAELAQLPEMPVPKREVMDCTATEFASICSAAGQLGRAWGPVSRGQSFLWRNLKVLAAGGLQGATRRQDAAAALQAAGALEEQCILIHSDLQLVGQTQLRQTKELALLLKLLEDRPPIGEKWLTEQSSEGIESIFETMADRLDEHGKKIRDLDGRAPAWRSVDKNSWGRVQSTLAEIETARPPTAGIGAKELLAIAEVSEALLETARALTANESGIKRLAYAFGFEGSINVDLAGRLGGLAALGNEDYLPEEAWLTQSGVRKLKEAQEQLQPLIADYQGHRASLKEIFRESVLNLDLDALRIRFRDAHKGLKKLSGSYRADKKAIADCTLTGKVTARTIECLEEAADWKKTNEELLLAEARFKEHLGSYYQDKNRVDFAKLARAAEVAKQAVNLAGVEISARELSQQIVEGVGKTHGLDQFGEPIREAMEELRTGPVSKWLNDKMELLLSVPLDDATTWCEERSAELRKLLFELEKVETAMQGVGQCKKGHVAESGEKFCGVCGEIIGSPATVSDLCGVLQSYEEVEELNAVLTKEKQSHAELLGDLINLEEGEPLRFAIEWVRQVRQACGGEISKRSAPLLLTTEITQNQLPQCIQGYDGAVENLTSHFETSYGQELEEDLFSTYPIAKELLAALEESVDEAEEWVGFERSKDLLENEGLGSVVRQSISEKIEADEVAGVLERAFLIRWVDQIIENDQRLWPTRSVDRNELRKKFQELDADLINSASATVINACAADRPSAAIGETAVIRQQASLGSQHKPLRKLFKEAGKAAQRLKPCFMMSPLTVSQHIPSDMIFDYVIFDEASQVKEADAVGAIYRGRQLIVAGDQKQLPPTAFFDRIISPNDEMVDEDNNEIELHEFESILDRCKAQGLTSLSLRWHYRSKHEDLITYSNRNFYENKLLTFPGAVFDSPDLGVGFYKVDGVYDRGGARDNQIEASKVVDRILFHRQEHPELSIGVVAFSVAQADEVEAEIIRRSDAEPELAKLDFDNRLDGFFVKNLESVQGDERDIIILTVGYGPDQDGKMTNNFGPLNRVGGERRLNVAVTRARSRVEIVTSIFSRDITGNDEVGEGASSVSYLKRYLEYAEKGNTSQAALTDEADSVLAKQVAKSIASWGYEVATRVGVADYRVDIGVKDPEQPGVFLLGVECDGPGYESSKIARDRDRIRQQVLEGLGWNFHRIWSTAWFSNRRQEEENLRQAIENARAGGSGSGLIAPPTGELPVIEVEIVDLDAPPEWLEEYKAPWVSQVRRKNQSIDDAVARPLLTTQITELVEGFGPIHSEDVLRRLLEAWGAPRLTAQVRTAFEAAILTPIAIGKIDRADDFLYPPGKEIKVRGSRSGKDGLRKVLEVPREELQLAAQKLLDESYGFVGSEELLKKWKRLFGWPRSNPQIKEALDGALAALVTEGKIEFNRDTQSFKGLRLLAENKNETPSQQEKTPPYPVEETFVPVIEREETEKEEDPPRSTPSTISAQGGRPKIQMRRRPDTD